MATYSSEATSPAVPVAHHALPTRNYLSQKLIWGGFVVGTLAVLMCCLLYFCIRRKLTAIFSKKRTRKGHLDGEKILLRRFQLEELERATNNFSRDRLVGTGGFGNVYRGTFDLEGTLAIKKAHADSYKSVEEFRNEVQFISKVKHQNLVGLVGHCEEDGAEGAKILIYEYIPNGSLLDHIMGRTGRSLTWRQRVNIAIGAAKGIAHLHEGVNPSIIHRDIKPSNILIGENFEAKVSDFGLVRLGPVGDQSHVSSQIKGTPGYLDPAYCSSFHLSPFSDVFSFGVILLQLLAARPAVDNTRNHSNNHIIEWARPSIERGNVEEILDANLLLEKCNMDMMQKMGELGLRCVVKSPKQRPTMTQVWKELEEALCSSDSFIHNQRPPSGPGRSIGNPRSMDQDSSQSFVSIDGIGFQRFHVEMDSFSFQSASLRCLEIDSVSVDIDNNNLKGICEETSMLEESSQSQSYSL